MRIYIYPPNIYSYCKRGDKIGEFVKMGMLSFWFMNLVDQPWERLCLIWGNDTSNPLIINHSY